MQIQFFGAAKNVTGSKHLITTRTQKKILLDCGFFQNKGVENDTLNRHFSFDPISVDFLILSHAHIDHSGNIPNLVKQGFKGPIYCTPATFDLCKIMLADSAKIQEGDILYLNRARMQKGMRPLKPLYTQNDVDICLNQFVTLPYNTGLNINENIELTLTDAGHLLGSAVVNLRIEEYGEIVTIAFTGDIGRPHDKILKDPAPFPQADYLIAESTYGDRLHETREDAEKKLLDCVIKTCVENKGKLIIPAFSVGRTQEIVYALDRMRTKGLLPKIKVFVDSPLSTNATNIMRKHSECFNEDIMEYMKTDSDPFGFNELQYIKDVEASIALNHLIEPCIIISASGMMEAGRIKHHLKNNLPFSKNTVLIVGYCPENTLGNRLLRGDKQVKIYGEEISVKADIQYISSYSSHGDYKEMMEFLSCQDKKKIKRIFLVHGEEKAIKQYKETLYEHGFHDIEIPEQGESFKIY